MAAVLKLQPLSEFILLGQSLLKINRHSAARKKAVNSSDTNSTCTTFFAEQMKKQI